jgi:hypothetical protein
MTPSGDSKYQCIWASKKRRGCSTVCPSISCETVSCFLGAGVTSPSNSNSSPQFTTLSTPFPENSDPSDHINKSPSTELQNAGDIGVEKLVDKSNVILPWLPLLEFMSRSFFCGICKQSISVSNFEKIQVAFATSLNFYCPVVMLSLYRLRLLLYWEKTKSVTSPVRRQAQTGTLCTICTMTMHWTRRWFWHFSWLVWDKPVVRYLVDC